MSKILSQNYSYANNSSGDLINVSTAKRNEKYFCPICGELMNPGQRRSSVAGLTEDDRQTVDKERQVGDPMQLRTEVLNL